MNVILCLCIELDELRKLEAEHKEKNGMQSPSVSNNVIPNNEDIKKPSFTISEQETEPKFVGSPTNTDTLIPLVNIKEEYKVCNSTRQTVPKKEDKIDFETLVKENDKMLLDKEYIFTNCSLKISKLRQINNKLVKELKILSVALDKTIENNKIKRIPPKPKESVLVKGF